MDAQEWLRSVSQDGSIQISDSVRSLVSRLGTYEEETLWTLLGLLSACFSDLGRAGHINSLPPSMDPATAGHIFTHCSNIMADAAQRLSGSGSASLDMPESNPSIVQEGL